jgi:hypothetical protein
MSFVLPWTVNKLVSTNINNADSITGGPYGNVSLKVGGKTQLVGDTVIEGNVGIGKATDASYSIDVSGNVRFSGSLTGTTLITTDVSCNNVSTQQITQSANNQFLTVSNYAFDTPVRAINTGAVVTAPYTAITGWSLSNISGTTPTISTGYGFWDTLGPNSFVTEYPGYPTVTQSLCVQQNAINTFRIQQSITATAGNYLVTFYIWGRFNGYSITQTVSCTFGTVTSSSNTAVEQAWKKIQFATQVNTAGSIPIIFNFILTNISIQQLGGIVSRNATSMDTGSCLRPDLGLYCYGGIYNTGPLDNYGPVTIYGQLNPIVPRVKNSLVIGNCKWGSASGGATDSGSFCQLIGDGIAANVSSAYSSGDFTNIVAIGSAALEQLNGTRTDMIAIGYKAARYAASQTSIAIGTGTMQNLGFSGNSSSNIAIGHLSMGQMGSNNNNNNCCVGNITLSILDFTNSRSFNSIFGNSSGTNVSSNSNTIIGYNSCANMINTTSSSNTFLGATCGNNQSGAGNVMTNCTFLGASSDVSSAGAYSNSTAVGYNSRIAASNQIVMGGDNGSGVFANVLLPNKNTLMTTLESAAATLNIAFGNAETIVITANTTTVINLPTPTASSVRNIGTIFTLLKSYTTPVAITVNAPSGQTIRLPTGATAASYTWAASEQYLQVVCIANTGTSWGIINSQVLTSGNLSNVVLVNSTQTISGAKTFSTPPVMSGASITSNTIPIGSIVSGGNIMLDNTNETISGIYTFSTNPVFNAGGIPVASIAGTAVNLSGTQTISGAKTFSTPPVMSGASITSNSIPIGSIVSGGNLVRNDTNATIVGVYTFSTPPIFGTNSINPNYVTNMISEPAKLQYAFGEFCLFQKIAGAIENSAFGHGVMSANSSVPEEFQGSGNCGFGAFSMNNSQTAVDNACYGNYSGFMIQGKYNSALGKYSMYNTDGSYNSMCGYSSGINPFVTGPVTLVSCSALGANTSFDGGEDHITLIGANCDRDPVYYPSSNAIILGRNTIDDTYVGKDLYVFGNTTITGDMTADIVNSITEINTNSINPYSGTSVTISNKLINNNLETNTINGTNITTLNIGNATPGTTTHLNGSTTISNAQRINGYATLSGSPNNLIKPLASVYSLTTATNGALTLPVIDATMYGSQIVFNKTSTEATWTINAGAGNTFRLPKSNSTATATSITLPFNDTTVRIVATQTTVWDVIDEDIMYDAVNTFVIGRQYFPYKINPTNITATTNWNTSFPAAFYGIQFVSLTSSSTLTLPLSTDSRVPPNMRIKFRRVGGTTTTSLGLIASTGDTILALNTTSSIAAGTSSVILASGVYQVEVILSGTQWVVML